MGTAHASESLNVKNGLYYKPVQNGRVLVNDKPFRIPPVAQYAFIKVEGNDVYMVDPYGRVISKLSPEKDRPHGTARVEI
ncbi:MAG: hypothetical protein EPN93_17345 [Spirochaetes bacterium]|nr:MAG: hypothetical protein EPN93_17345 [Spirochaetota bacterium]